MYRSIRLTIETLEDRTNPAPLLAVTAQQAEQVQAIAQAAAAGQTQPTTITLPVTAGESVCIAVDLTPNDGQDIWGSENALVWLERDASDPSGTLYRVGMDGQGVVIGSGDNAQAYSEFYAAGWNSHLVELTLVPELHGKIVTAPVLKDALLVAQLGDAFEGNGALLDGLKIAPTSLAVQQADGSLSLQLALPVGEGWQVYTLTSVAPSALAYSGWWTVTSIEQAASLTPQLGLWELV